MVATTEEARPHPQILPLGIAGLGLAVVALLAGGQGGLRLGLAVGIGAVAGFALYHAAFGFTAGWRRMIVERRGMGLRAQMALLVVTGLVSYPLIAFGSTVWGGGVGGFVFPFGIGAAVGATLFGAGMMLAGGCGSGTLFTVGGGSTRMAVTLSAFVLGSLVGTAHLPWWGALPRLERFSMVSAWGPWTALAILAAFCTSIWIASVVLERRAHAALERPRRTGSLLQGPWSPTLGVIALAFVGIATFFVLGRPWGITSGFALWGAKIAQALGIEVETWRYWRFSGRALERSVFADATSVMNFAIVFGAMVASAAATRWRPTLRIAPRELATAVAGGLLMGYGARLSYGCNIGAYLGGIASGSMHGWLWAVFAFGGSMAMLDIRRRRWPAGLASSRRFLANRRETS